MKPEKCAYCGDMVDIPFECTYCKDGGPGSSKFKRFFGRFR